MAVIREVGQKYKNRPKVHRTIDPWLAGLAKGHETILERETGVVTWGCGALRSVHTPIFATARRQGSRLGPGRQHEVFTTLGARKGRGSGRVMAATALI